MSADIKISYTPSFEELKAQFIRDIRLCAEDGGVSSPLATGPGSDADLTATAVSNQSMFAVNNAALAERNANVLYAIGDKLDAIREGDGLPVVLPAGGTGKIVISTDGPATITNKTRFIYPNGVTGEVVGTYLNVSDRAEVNVKALETGEKTNLGAREKVRFATGIPNVQPEATVSSEWPITGGVSKEGDERKRSRILNNRRNRPAGGNWGQQRKDVLDQVPGVQECYNYPALGGPSSAKIVVVRDFDLKNRSFSRACSDALLQQVRGVVWGNNSSNNDLPVQTANDTPSDVAARLRLPSSALSGGSGKGWTDSYPWPQPVAADSGVVTVSIADASLSRLVVSANTTVPPIAGQTNIAWWSVADMTFYTTMIVGVLGSSGVWDLTLSRPLLDKDGNEPSAGDYICPSAVNLKGYAAKWVEMFRALGPGENTTDVNRLPRSKRRPYVSDEDPSGITSIFLANLAADFPEITGISATVSVSDPPVPASANVAPAILVPRHFAIYPE